MNMQLQTVIFYINQHEVVSKRLGNITGAVNVGNALVWCLHVVVFVLFNGSTHA